MPGTSESSQPQSARGFARDPDLQFWHPRPQAFVAAWRERIPAGLSIPPRSAFTPETLQDFLSYLLVVEMDPSRQRYRNRLIGTEVVARAGRDSTGKWFDEIYSGATLDSHHQAHQWILAERRPLRMHGTMDFVGRGWMPVEAAIVPLALDRPDYIEQFMICIAYGDLQQD